MRQSTNTAIANTCICSCLCNASRHARVMYVLSAELPFYFEPTAAEELEYCRKADKLQWAKAEPDYCLRLCLCLCSELHCHLMVIRLGLLYLLLLRTALSQNLP